MWSVLYMNIGQNTGEICPHGGIGGQLCGARPAASRGVCGNNNLCVAATAEEPVTREESEESCSSGQVWKAAFRMCCPVDRPRVKTDSVTGNKSCVACTVNEHCQNTGEICPHGGIGGQLCGARPAASRGVCSNYVCGRNLQTCPRQNSRGECIRSETGSVR